MPAEPLTAELVCIGLATADTIVLLPRWPEPDDRVLVDPPVRSGGGPAATAAVAAARLGRSVAFVGAVGNDRSGDAVRSGLVDEGIDVNQLDRRPGRTAESVILVDGPSAGRAILHAPGMETRALSPAALAACRAAAWIHVDHAGWPLVASSPAPHLPRSRVSVDAGNPVAELELAGLGLYAPTATALRARYPGLGLEAAVRRALGEGAERVVVTLGAVGALGADRAGAWRVAAPAVDALSTLGAGDVFHGALLAGLLEGLGLPDALRLASVAAALSCRALDGRSGIPRRDELEAALAGSPAVEAVALGEDR